LTQKHSQKEKINNLDKNIKTIIDDMIEKKKKENDMLGEHHDGAKYEIWVYELFCDDEPETKTEQHGDDESHAQQPKDVILEKSIVEDHYEYHHDKEIDELFIR